MNHADSVSVVAEEPHVLPIQNDQVLSLFFRTSQGYMGHAQSYYGDPTRAWHASTFARYLPSWKDDFVNASWVKHPRSDPSRLVHWHAICCTRGATTHFIRHTIRRCLHRGPLSPKRQPNGLVLMTYYNTAPLGAFASHMPINDRSHMFLTAGMESNGTVLWSQPELVLYDRDRTR